MDSSGCRPKSPSRRLESIDEDGSASCLPVICGAPPVTPTEPMEFHSRSWSLSATELSKALTNTCLQSYAVGSAPLRSLNAEVHDDNPRAPSSAVLRNSELFLLQQALNPDFLSNQNLLKTGIDKSMLRGKKVGRWLKDRKEKKKQELRTHNAQLHVATSVAGVAAAVAAVAASSAVPSDTTSAAAPFELQSVPSKTSAAIASAAALVASHCVEFAEEMGADRDQILAVVDSAVNVGTASDIMTLTAEAATLRAGEHKGLWASPVTPADDQIVVNKETRDSQVLQFVSEGRELLKRTRKGALHWKKVSFYVNSRRQVVAKLKSKHMAAAFSTKKRVVSDVYCDTPAWPQRKGKDGSEQRAYFGIQTDHRVIEFECRSKGDKQMWTDGIRLLLHCRTNMMT